MATEDLFSEGSLDLSISESGLEGNAESFPSDPANNCWLDDTGFREVESMTKEGDDSELQDVSDESATAGCRDINAAKSTEPEENDRLSMDSADDNYDGIAVGAISALSNLRKKLNVAVQRSPAKVDQLMQGEESSSRSRSSESESRNADALDSRDSRAKSNESASEHVASSSASLQKFEGSASEVKGLVEDSGSCKSEEMESSGAVSNSVGSEIQSKPVSRRSVYSKKSRMLVASLRGLPSSEEEDSARVGSDEDNVKSRFKAIVSLKRFGSRLVKQNSKLAAEVEGSPRAGTTSISAFESTCPDPSRQEGKVDSLREKLSFQRFPTQVEQTTSNSEANGKATSPLTRNAADTPSSPVTTGPSSWRRVPFSPRFKKT